MRTRQVSPVSGDHPTRYLFIDGRYLQHVIADASKDFYGGIQLPISYESISRGFRKCFYYDCLPPRSSQEDEQTYLARCAPTEELFEQLRMIDGWHVFEGLATGKGKKRGRQKKVDVKITVDMLSHTHNRNMDELTFIAGDADFTPLLDAVVQDGMYCRLWYQPRSVSPDLLMAADARSSLNIYQIADWLPFEFTTRYPLPQKSLEQRVVTGFFPIADGIGQEKEIHLRRRESDGLYVITHAFPANPGSFHHMSSRDIKLLKLTYSSVFGSVQWSDEVTNNS